MHTEFIGNPEVRNHLRNHRRLIIKWILNKWGVCGLDSSGSE
jgi:hypothetical protein